MCKINSKWKILVKYYVWVMLTIAELKIIINAFILNTQANMSLINGQLGQYIQI